jgi:hypothetical protein
MYLAGGFQETFTHRQYVGPVVHEAPVCPAPRADYTTPRVGARAAQSSGRTLRLDPCLAQSSTLDGLAAPKGCVEHISPIRFT